MALQPSLQPLVVVGNPDAPHTLEAFLDYVCPFSAKLSRAIDNHIKPLVSQGGKYRGKVKVIFRLQVQPWHASSTLTHEAGLAVLRASPDNFWVFSRLLFDSQDDYFDKATLDLTPRQIRDNLATLASKVIPSEAVDKVRDLLTLKGSANGGTSVTGDLKYNIKFARQNSIHVSPTVLWDGLIANEVSSGWGEKEWTEFFVARVTV
ncbi:Disulfide bond formation protein D [Leucoagaricus sp. SymC.cos]|nr:Disulfide bond formation protein D [Leucoagaricus sp. SymC.cos]